ncbi:MAG: hypothetical protein MRJ65_05300 [Candidatus Brocadiaceae bacterium]|nr:hypothetical protein [Candidatus Brocadiaceae bacterium]
MAVYYTPTISRRQGRSREVLSEGSRRANLRADLSACGRTGRQTERSYKVVKTDQCTFLGFVFKGKSIRWSDNSLAEFRRQIRLLTGRSWGVFMNYRFRKLRDYIRGWVGYYGLSEYYRPIPGLDHWLRRRIRMCYWKQWRRCRKRVNELLKLGCSKLQAILKALSRKSYWRLSKTFATQVGMTNQWLKKQGLISIRELWISFHYPNKTRYSS